MIPLEDDVCSRSFPAVTWFLVAVNVGIFVYELQLGPRLDGFFEQYGLIPARLFAAGSPRDLAPVLTSMFLHGGFLHVIGNMLYLHVFGDNVEDRLGHFRYLGFYLAAGFVAALTHAFLAPSSNVPMVGASGAIAGVIGAYFVNFPRARVVTAVPVFFFVHFVRVPAVLLLLLWFLLQLGSGAAVLEAGDAQAGVAWWAHIGGFVFGAALGLPLRRSRGRRRRWFPA